MDVLHLMYAVVLDFIVQVFLLTCLLRLHLVSVVNILSFVYHTLVNKCVH